jgi:hypothetical protein
VRHDTRMPRAMIAAFVVLVGGSALTAACNEGDKKMPPFGSKSSSWNELKVPGVELFVETQKSEPYRPTGAARIDGSGGLLRGKEAFDATRTRVGGDATALATLAMLFLDDRVAGRKPWTQPSTGGSTSQDQEKIARPPVVSGDSLVYWRLHIQLSDLVRCTVAMSAGTVQCESGRDLVFADRVAKDPAGAANQDLASDNIEVRLDGIRALGHVGDDASRKRLIEIALNAYQPRERSTAIEVLTKVGGAGVVDAIGRALLYDKFDEVREAAATALGDLHDPAGRDALQRAESGDADIRVRVLATEALKKLK